jgi:hypothetical protein
MLVSVEVDEWRMDTFFEKVRKAMGEETLSKLCLLDDQGQPKLVKRTEDHFDILIIWAVKLGKLNISKC